MKSRDRYRWLFSNLGHGLGRRIFYPGGFLALLFFAEPIKVNTKARGCRGSGRQKRRDDIRINHKW